MVRYNADQFRDVMMGRAEMIKNISMQAVAAFEADPEADEGPESRLQGKIMK